MRAIIYARHSSDLSRDQEDVAALFKRLRFLDIRLVTLGHGEITALAGILALGKEERPRPGGRGRSTTLVAGAGFVENPTLSIAI